ncbi:hypothetical protein C8A00DRAFT_13571 [Chaetomidium leptoderma]|uniref:Uncharacterized protein n=1 Tax=Chaetomidium leptoderma TaxID=669021 RepID=A0AAN6VPI2_9PEZI|nr:hypothetical protein C8A00DRAFT_13571 [Chaetomidium leptoderma]
MEQRPEIVRALIESRKLSGKDLFALSRVNTAVFRLMFTEMKRLRVKTIPFATRRSPIWCIVEVDYPEGMDEALRLGEFDKDTTCPNGRFLHSDGGRGIHLVLAMCINKGSTSCFNFLMKWLDDPATPFTYNPMWVYEKARAAALRDGRLTCLMFLYDRYKDGRFPPCTPIYTTLLEQARSPAAIAWLSRRMPRDTDYRPILITQCSNPYTQAVLIEVLMDLIPKSQLSLPASLSANHNNNNNNSDSENNSDDTDDTNCNSSDTRKSTTALAEAAAIHHLPAVHVLLRDGARAFAVCVKMGSVPHSATSNPLFRALAHPLVAHPADFFLLHLDPTPQPNSNGSGAGGSFDFEEYHSLEARERRKRTWQAQMERNAEGMRYVVAHLVDAAALEFPRRGGGGSCDTISNAALKREILEWAAVVFVHTLRACLLGFMAARHPRVEQPRGRPLVVPAVRGRATAWSGKAAVESRFGDEGRGPIWTEADLDCTWRRPMLPAWLVRDKLEDEGFVLGEHLETIWGLLVTPTTAEALRVWLRFSMEVRDERSSLVDINDRSPLDILWELLLAQERDVPMPRGRRGYSDTDDESECESESEEEEEDADLSDTDAEPAR